MNVAKKDWREELSNLLANGGHDFDDFEPFIMMIEAAARAEGKREAWNEQCSGITIKEHVLKEIEGRVRAEYKPLVEAAGRIRDVRYGRALQSTDIDLLVIELDKLAALEGK